MKDNNLNYVPSTPKTYEVRYLENKQSSLSPAARTKVINCSGSNYVSERTSLINPGYGPMPNNSSNPFSLTITISGDNDYKPAFEVSGTTFSTYTLNSLDEARELAIRLDNFVGIVKIVDTKNNNRRDMDFEKEVKKAIEEKISEFEKEDLKEGESRGYGMSFSRIA
jgi:hypothetical protein